MSFLVSIQLLHSFRTAKQQYFGRSQVPLPCALRIKGTSCSSYCGMWAIVATGITTGPILEELPSLFFPFLTIEWANGDR